MLTPGRHYVNTTVRIAVNFQDDDGTDVDPSTVSFKSYSPNGAISSYVYGTDSEVIRANTGDYYVDFVPAQSGRWFYRWASTGSGTAIALEGEVVVQASVFFDDAAGGAYQS
jgi:hypothetical protein